MEICLFGWDFNTRNKSFVKRLTCKKNLIKPRGSKTTLIINTSINNLSNKKGFAQTRIQFYTSKLTF